MDLIIKKLIIIILNAVVMTISVSFGYYIVGIVCFIFALERAFELQKILNGLLDHKNVLLISDHRVKLNKLERKFIKRFYKKYSVTSITYDEFVNDKEKRNELKLLTPITFIDQDDRTGFDDNKYNIIDKILTCEFNMKDEDHILKEVMDDIRK